ncbi:hypothetical protein [Microbacterium sp. KR10-403]|uniref:hypothetical protein n=1 Tax=Microbacterium sp. KR10-403 TaxID=3158581 RepID=UPI0032E3B720
MAEKNDPIKSTGSRNGMADLLIAQFGMTPGEAYELLDRLDNSPVPGSVPGSSFKK